MQKNMQTKYLNTLGYILKRTNYGEADRILNIITPYGKISAIAKGVRKEKSKLAGGVELFSLINFNISLGRSELGIVTSAKMIEFYGNILKDFARMELAAMILKKISVTAESPDSSEYFNIVEQSLSGLNKGLKNELVETWFLLNLLKASGEEINLYRDTAGNKLAEDKRYAYDITEKSMVENSEGEFGAEEIKLLRLMLVTKLEMVARVKNIDQILLKILRLAQIMSGEV